MMEARTELEITSFTVRVHMSARVKSLVPQHRDCVCVCVCARAPVWIQNVNV